MRPRWLVGIVPAMVTVLMAQGCSQPCLSDLECGAGRVCTTARICIPVSVPGGAGPGGAGPRTVNPAPAFPDRSDACEQDGCEEKTSSGRDCEEGDCDK